MYRHETHVALVKERCKAKRKVKRLRIVAGSLVVAALILGAVLGAAAARKEDMR